MLFRSGIGWGIGSKINPVSKTSSSTPNYSTFDLSDISNILPFNSKNLKKGIKRYDDPNDRSNVVVYGITTKEISVIFEYETYYYMGIIKFDGQYVVTGVSCQAEVNGQWVDVSAYISDIFSNCVDVYSSNTSYNHYKFKLYGYRANVEVPTDAEKYIRCYVWLDSQTAKLTPVQNVARAYYSNKEYYEFDCRLNPCIEPQDNIYVDGIGLLRVEELSLSFNGAFNGSIKARKFGDFSLQPVTISDLAYGTGYSFHINNPNDRPVYAYIWFYSDDDGKYVWTRKSIPANSYVHVTSTNTPTLTPRFNDATNKELETDVYVETIDQALPNLKADSYTYILYALSSPSISAIDYDDRGNFSFMVTNESKSSVTLYIIYSGQSATTLTFSISAGETITINNDNASQLFSSFYAKAYGELIDDVYCYFTITSTQQQSDNSIILRDDT